MQEVVTIEVTRSHYLDSGCANCTPPRPSRSTALALASDDCRWSRRGKLWRGPKGAYVPVVIDVYFGYDMVPDDIASVVLSATRRLLANPTRLRSDQSSEQASRTFVGESDGFTVGELVVLNRGRRRAVAS